MPQFAPNVPVETSTPDVLVDSMDLGIGEHVFELVVVDEAGNKSKPSRWRVTVTPPSRPVAVITTPPRVIAGVAFQLGAQKSVAPPGRRLVLFQWQVGPPGGQPFTARTEVPVFNVPVLPPVSSLNVQLVVRDDAGALSDPAQMTLAVTPG